jgi:hypothetical protein
MLHASNRTEQQVVDENLKAKKEKGALIFGHPASNQNPVG